jgi:glycosyltransferase involved in cell wall biosynthesis
MLDLWIPGFALLACFVLLPVVWTWRTVWFVGRHSGNVASAESELPRAAIILAVRGADPSLSHCLAGILRQDYPRYSVRIVVDSQQDRGWDMVHDVLQKGHNPRVNVEVNVLQRRHDTCSLKVSSQLQAIAELDPAIEVVAFIDADSIPAADWLRALVLPFADPQVGATTGFRWFAPSDSQWGTLVRYMYNAGSAPQMYVFSMAWGGSMAVRTRIFRESDLLDVWSRSFCEDVGVYSVIRKRGFRLAFVPDATHINCESIDLASCFNFLMRQLLCVRLQVFQWPWVLAINVSHNLALIVTIAWLGQGLYERDWDSAALAGSLFGLYLAGLLSALSVGELLIRRIVGARRKDIPPPAFSWKTVPALLLTQVLAFFCLVCTMFVRRIAWRGVTYAIQGPENIRLLEYQPFQGKVADPNRSVI